MPAVLAIDEATSGLDSQSSKAVFQAIKSYAQTYNIGIIAALQQPGRELLNLFDDVGIIANNTQTYFGPVGELNSYFSKLGYSIKSNCSGDYFLFLAQKQIREVELQFPKSHKENNSRRQSMTSVRNLYSQATLIYGNNQTASMNIEPQEVDLM